MPQKIPVPWRQIHLDFHTGPWIKDVAVDFNANRFADALAAAHVNSVTVFAKCHHGHLYYNTKRPERHPGLPRRLDLLAQQVRALHRRGIRAPIYISVQCDEYAADTHPEWIARYPEGQPVGPWPLAPGWQILDMNSPYQDYLAEQTAEVLQRFDPVDGIFFDMCWDQPSVGNYAVDAMVAAGLNPEDPAQRHQQSHNVALAYMHRFRKMVKAANPRATAFFNSRPLGFLHQYLDVVDQVEIEALPTGGAGYMFFPKSVRYVRTFDRPYLGMTARFHKHWADFGALKPYAALEYETSIMMAHGARCSVGDQLHPRGEPDPAVYDLIGRVYKRVADREPWLQDAKPVTQVGLFQLCSRDYHPGRSVSDIDDGATRMLVQLRQQFDVISPDRPFDHYDLLVLPDIVNVNPALRRRLTAYVRRGGKLLLTGTSGLDATGKTVLFPPMGIRTAGPSPFTTTYMRLGPEISQDVPAEDHVIYEPTIRVTAGSGTRTLARVVEPYFNRTWQHFVSHAQTPPARLARWAAATIHGNVAYIPHPVFFSYNVHGNYPGRLLVRNILDLLLPDPLLRLHAPTGTEATIMRQRNRTIVHLLHYSPERRSSHADIIEDIVPLYDVPLSVKLPRRPRKVYMAPSREPVPFTWLNGRANLLVPEVRGHAMVVYE